MKRSSRSRFSAGRAIQTCGAFGHHVLASRAVAALLGVALAVAPCILGATPAAAQDTMARVRARGVLRCGAVERPGIAEAPPTGGIVGVAVDICRAVGVAVLGAKGRVAFRLYETTQDFNAVRRWQDDLAFLTGGEIAEQALGARILPGPRIAIDQMAVMVPQASPARGLDGLAGQTVCMMTGSEAQRAMESAVTARHIPIARLMFQEDVEMLDAYNAGRCDAVAGGETYLAEMRLTPGVRGVASRLLPDSLGAESFVAVTNPADGAWAARVAWVFNALLLAGGTASPWHAAGVDASPVKALPGLQPDWAHQVTAAVGSYADIVRRNLTDRLGLPPGPNAPWPNGIQVPVAVH
ncbi:MAG TPA: transporter substrate-binding domain-containing protein [Rhodopila sp.]|nr:transporter substrate-binding domain-containing protein [Rhodopila sp.]